MRQGLKAKSMPGPGETPRRPANTPRWRKTAKTAAVCSFPKGNTDQGLCDMVGNVFEITADAFHRTYEGAPTDGSAWMYEEEDYDSYSIARGASFRETAIHLRTTFRGIGPKHTAEQGGAGRTGFRCAK